MRSPRLILALCLMTGLAACHRGESADNSPPPTNKQLIENGDADVAKVCASDETLDGLKAVVMNSVDAAKATPAINPADLTEIETGGHVALDSAVLSSFDKTTRKVTCSARIGFTWPQDVADRLKAAYPARPWRFVAVGAQYTIQPQADDRALVYAPDQVFVDKARVTVLTVLRALIRAETAANAPPAYSSAVESSAAASDPSVDPDATGDTSIRGSKPAN